MGINLRCAALLPALSLLAAPAATAAAERPRLPVCGNALIGAKVKPRTWSPGCAGSSPLFRRLEWHRWGRRARATGRVLRCTADACERSRGRIVAFRVRRCEGPDGPVRVYTRTRLTVLGETYRQPLPCEPVGRGSAEAAAVLAPRRCADVVIRNPDGSVYTGTHGLWATRVRCRRARRVARIYLRRSEGNAGGPVRPLGFRCSGGADGVVCRNGTRRVTWGYYYD